MDTSDTKDITRLLDQVRRDVPGAADQLAAQVYDELHKIAVAAMRRESPGHTLRPTELVDEAFVRLIKQDKMEWQNRSHFYAIGARTIRRILLDHARHRSRIKRDHGIRVTLDDGIGEAGADPLDLIALDDALTRLAAVSPRQAEVIELRFFGGLENEDVAEVMNISVSTVKRDWTFARAFLLHALTGGDTQ